MAITTSIGYDGSINEGQHARLMSEVGTSLYTVLGANDFKVESDASQVLGIHIRPGYAYGYGVLDYNDANIIKAIPPVTSGIQRIDLVVVRRNFSTNTTTIEILPGSDSGPPGYVGFNTSGTTNYAYSEQPIATVTVAKNNTTVGAIRDYRLQMHKVIALPQGSAFPPAARPGMIARSVAQFGGIKEYTTVLNSDGSVSWTDTSTFGAGRKYIASNPTYKLQEIRKYGAPDGIYGSGLQKIDLPTVTAQSFILHTSYGYTIAQDGVYAVSFGAYSDGPGPGVSNVLLTGMPNMDLSALDQRQGGTGWNTPAAGLLNQQASRTGFIASGTSLNLYAGYSSNMGTTIDYNFTLIIERIGS